MEQISIYFKKFEGLGSQESFIKKSLISAILEVLGEDVEEEITSQKIKIEKENIKINVFGPIKNEIVLNKRKIQSLFEEKLSSFKQKTNKRII